MKKILIILLSSFLFTGCMSLIPRQTSVSDVSAFYSNGVIEYDYTDGYYGMSKLARLRDSKENLYIAPRVIVDTNSNYLSYFITIFYNGPYDNVFLSPDDAYYVSFTFVNREGKNLTIEPVISLVEDNVFKKYCDPVLIPTNEYKLQITDDQFKLLSEFFSSSSVISCRAVTVDNRDFFFAPTDSSLFRVFSSLYECVKIECADIPFNNSITQIHIN